MCCVSFRQQRVVRNLLACVQQRVADIGLASADKGLCATTFMIVATTGRLQGRSGLGVRQDGTRDRMLLFVIQGEASGF